MSEYADIVLAASANSDAPAYYGKAPQCPPPVKRFFCGEAYAPEGFSRARLAVLGFREYAQELCVTSDFDLLLAARALCGYAGLDADELYADYFYRCRRGVSRGFAYFEQGEPAAFVFADYIDRDRAVIGSLAVSEKYRGRGLGGRLTAFAASQYKRALLACVPPLAGYYERYGFDAVGELFEYTRL